MHCPSSSSSILGQTSFPQNDELNWKKQQRESFCSFLNIWFHQSLIWLLCSKEKILSDCFIFPSFNEISLICELPFWKSSKNILCQRQEKAIDSDLPSTKESYSLRQSRRKYVNTQSDFASFLFPCLSSPFRRWSVLHFYGIQLMYRLKEKSFADVNFSGAKCLVWNNFLSFFSNIFFSRWLYILFFHALEIMIMKIKLPFQIISYSPSSFIRKIGKYIRIVFRQLSHWVTRDEESFLCENEERRTRKKNRCQ